MGLSVKIVQMALVLPVPWKHRYPELLEMEEFKQFANEIRLEEKKNILEISKAIKEYTGENKQKRHTTQLRLFIIDVLLSNYYLNECLSFIAEPQNKEEWLYKALCYYRLNNYKAIQDLLHKFQAQYQAQPYEEIGFYQEAMFLLIALVRRSFGFSIVSQLETFYDLVEEEEQEQLLPLYKLLMYSVVSYIYFYRGEIDNCEIIAKKTRYLAEKEEDLYLLAMLENLAGIIAMKRGEYQEALALMELALEYSEKTGVNVDTGRAVNNRAAIYATLGKWQKAYEELQHFYEIANNPLHKLIAITNIGEVLCYLNRKEEAREKLEEAISIVVEDNLTIAEPYMNMALIHLYEGDQEQVLQNLDEANRILKITNDVNASVYYHYLLAWYKIKFEEKKRDAIKLLKTCLNEALKTYNYEYVIKAQLFLVDIYITDFLITRSIDDYSRIIYYADNIIKISREQNLPHVEADIIIMKGRIDMINGDYDGARERINEGRRIANENYYIEIRSKAEDLLNEINQITSREKKITLKKQELDVPSMQEQYNSFKFIKEAKKIKNNVYATLLVDMRSGVPYYEKYFKKKKETEKEEIDEILVSTTLSAIQMYTDNMMERKTKLSSFSYQNYAILMDTVTNNDNLILICDQETFDIRVKIKNLKHSIMDKKINLDALKKFNKKDHRLDELIENFLNTN